MARLEARAKLGFFPTPEHLLPVIASHISPLSQLGSFLDPCCGEGDALNLLGLLLAGKTYGIELDRERGTEAKSRVHSVLVSDAMRTRTSDKSFSLLFLNPPYDWAVRNGELGEKSERVEHEFLLRFTPKLVDGGLLVFVVPYYVLAKSAVYLSNWYRDIRVFKFPEEDYNDFKQVVVFGVKKPKSSPDDFMKARLVSLGRGEIESSTLSAQESCMYSLPPSPVPDLFHSLDVEEEEAERYSNSSPLWSDYWREIDRVDTPRPIMPLKKGHLALLLASGYLDGRLRAKGWDLILKGSTRRVTQSHEEVIFDEDGNETTVIKEIDKVEVSISALNLATGLFHEIK